MQRLLAQPFDEGVPRSGVAGVADDHRDPVAAACLLQVDIGGVCDDAGIEIHELQQGGHALGAVHVLVEYEDPRLAHSSVPFAAGLADDGSAEASASSSGTTSWM